MHLTPVYTFPLELVHLSRRVPVAVRGVRYAPADPDARTDFTGRIDPDTRCPTDVDVRPDVPPHGHAFYEVVFIRGGEGYHVTDEEDRPLRRGTALIVPPGMVHGYRQMRNISKINLFYIAEWLAADLADLWRRHDLLHLFLSKALFGPTYVASIITLELSEPVLDRCLRELGDIAEVGRAERPNILYLRACLVKVLALLCEVYSDGRAGRPSDAFRDEVWTVLDEVERALLNGRPLEVRRIAAQCDCTPEHLTRLFRGAVGYSVMQYFQRRRMHLAGRMLLESDRSMTDIAHELGFADISHFRRTFRQHYGAAPGEYRGRREAMLQPPDWPM